MERVLVRLSVMWVLLQVAAACHPFEDTSAHPFAGAQGDDIQTTITPDKDSSDPADAPSTSDTKTSKDGFTAPPDSDEQLDVTTPPPDSFDPGDSTTAPDSFDPGDSTTARDTFDPGDSTTARDTFDPGDSTITFGDTFIDPGDTSINPSDTLITFNDIIVSDGITAVGCGDGLVDSNEACDSGPNNSDITPGACRTDCTLPRCGDGVIDISLGERCDDANNITGDGCAACTIEIPPSCGDGTWNILQGEACDDGNNVNNDGCDTSCQLEVVGLGCGDNLVLAPERCDDANQINGDGCNPTCNLFGEVDTLVAHTLTLGGGLAVDDHNAWIGINNQIFRLPLDTGCLTGTASACALIHVAGTGTTGHTDNTLGTSAVLGAVGSMATDGNFVYFADEGQTLRAMSTAPPHSVSTVAGQVGACGINDGIGAQATFHDIRGLVMDRGVIYLLDSCYAVLRAFNPNTRLVSTVAGVPNPVSHPGVCQAAVTAAGGTFSCNEIPQGIDGGLGTGRMVSPRYMTSAHNGMLYIADTNGETLRSYNTSTHVLGTIAGGQQGYVDGIGTAAQLDRPRGLASDGTSLYWGEQNAHTIRQLVLSSAQVTTLAGRRGCPGSLDGIGGSGTTPNNCSLPSTFNTPTWIAYHFPSRTFIVRDNNGLRLVR
jgi:cysteine-rich repeat protein